MSSKISGLSAGAPAVGTDLLPIARSGANFSLQVSDLFSNIASSRVPFGTSSLLTSSANFTYSDTASVASGPQLTVGSGSAGSAGLVIGTLVSGDGAIWPTNVTRDATNYLIRYGGAGVQTRINASNIGLFELNGTVKMYLQSGGFGPFTNGYNLGGNGTPSSGALTRWEQGFFGDQNAITASTPAIDVAQTWNNAGIGFVLQKAVITVTAANNAASRLFSYTLGATEALYASLASPTVANLTVNGTLSGTTISGFGGNLTATGLVLSSTATIGFGNATPGTQDLGLSRLASNSMALGTGTASDFSGALKLTMLNSVGAVQAGSATAITAGGSLLGHLISSTTNFGIFGGSGLPTISAAQGSLYLRSDGAINARLYINTDGATTWTAFNTTS